MLPSEIVGLATVLLSIPVTNSEDQALKWAWKIQKGLREHGYEMTLAERPCNPQ